ncbi:MAG: recombinase family protein [Candidatus Bipolaricaulaceae bacterium]
MRATKRGNGAAGYIRVSTTKQALNGESLAAQEAAIKSYCERTGLVLAGIYRDDGESGTIPFAERPAAQTLLEHITGDPNVGHVVVTRLDRLGRSCLDVLATVQSFEKLGVALHLLDLSVDTRSPSGRFFLAVLGAFAQLERDLISERTRAVLRHKRTKGEVYSPPPFGYRAEGGRLVAVEEETATIQLIRELRAQGQSYWTRASQLNALGLRPKRGNRWYPMTVRRVYLREEVRT